MNFINNFFNCRSIEAKEAKQGRYEKQPCLFPGKQSNKIKPTEHGVVILRKRLRKTSAAVQYDESKATANNVEHNITH